MKCTVWKKIRERAKLTPFYEFSSHLMAKVLTYKDLCCFYGMTRGNYDYSTDGFREHHRFDMVHGSMIIDGTTGVIWCFEDFGSTYF